MIALSHLGSTEESGNYSSIYLIHNTRGIDAVLDGHAHVVMYGEEYPNADGEDVLLASVGTKMQNAGELIIEPDGTVSCVLISEYDKTDETIQKCIDDANGQLEELLSQKIGDLDFDMPMTDENGYRITRSRETAISNFVADAYRYAMGTEIGIINGGGVRSPLLKGEITYGSLLDIAPFQNYGVSCEATGQQILDALEYGAQSTEAITGIDDKAAGENGAFICVSGLKYTIDTSVPTGVKKDENGIMTGIDGERRVKDVYVLKNGEYVPIDPEAVYTVSGSNYVLKENGDGNTAFNGAKLLVSEGPVDVNILIRYVQEHGNTVDDSYRTTEGRITVR